MENSKFIASFIKTVAKTESAKKGLIADLTEAILLVGKEGKRGFQKELYAEARTAGQYDAVRKIWSLAIQGKTSGVATTKADETPLVKFLRESATRLNRRNGVQDFSPVVYAMLTDCMNEYKAEAEAEAEAAE